MEIESLFSQGGVGGRAMSHLRPWVEVCVHVCVRIDREAGLWVMSPRGDGLFLAWEYGGRYSSVT